MSPLLPIFLLCLGALVLLFGLSPRFPQVGLAALVTSALAWLAHLILLFWVPAQAIFSEWGPTSLLPLGLILDADPLSWLLALAVLSVTLATFLTGVARPGGRRLLVRGAILLLTAAALSALFAGNLLTRVLAWAGLDLIYFLALLFLARGEGLEPQAVLNLSFNSAGTLLAVGAALLISRTSPELSLRDAALTSQSTLLITLAAMFRLGLFPLHLGLPAEVSIRRGLGTVLRVLPAVVALEMMSRLAVFGFAEAARPWLMVFALAATLVGATQLWNLDDPRLGITYVIIQQSGVALIAGLAGGELALPAILAQVVALVVGCATLYLYNGFASEGRQRWLALLPLLGASGMVGLPFTAGFPAASGLYGGLIASGNWLVIIGVFIAQSLLFAGLLRVVFLPSEPIDDDPITITAYGVGLGLPTVVLVMVGLASGVVNRALGLSVSSFASFAGSQDLAPLGLVLLSLGLGFALWRFEGLILAQTEHLNNPLSAFTRLDWLYRLIWQVAHGVGRLVFGLAEILEGEGAVLWTLVGALLLWLLFRS